MSQPLDSTVTPSATLDVARSRANTGASLSAAPYGTSLRSAAGSSVVSNGSLLDLYARSPGSVPSSNGVHTMDNGNLQHPAATVASELPHSASTSSSNTMPFTPTSRGFQTRDRDEPSSARGFSIPPSDSNASVWTTASAAATESLPQSKRASMAGFDMDAMRSVQAANRANAASPSATEPPLQPHIGVEAPHYDSDGSHYDDEEMPGAFTHDSFDRSADRTIEPPTHRNPADDAIATERVQEDQVYSNALPSPPVPRRTSSVMQDSFNMSPSASQMDDLMRTDLSHARHAASRSNSSHLSSGQIPQRRSSVDIRDGVYSRQASREPSQESSPGLPSDSIADTLPNTASRGSAGPTKGSTLRAVDENARPATAQTEGGSRSSHEPSLDEQRRLERELLEETDEARPRTLKEARERAKMRRQQSEVASPTSASATSGLVAAPTTSPRKSPTRHVRDVASFATSAGPDDNASRSSIDSRDRPLRNPKRMSNRDSALNADRRSISDRSAPSDYSHDSDAEGPFTLQEPPLRSGEHGLVDDRSGWPGSSQQTANMDDLTDAVNNAMNDLSFGSAEDTLSAEDEFATPLPPAPKAQDSSTSRVPASLASARSLASITGAQQHATSEPVRSSPLASPTKHTLQTPRASGTSSSQMPSVNTAHSRTSPSPGSPAVQRIAQGAAAPPRSAPSIPSRIEVYGKTLPMPKAFASSSIVVDKRRMSSWERARTYAQYTNELLHLQTGLSLWMEVVQRPAMRQQNNRTNQGKQAEDWLTRGTAPRSHHPRNEGSYADSIRSDMTFPMRGDGAKAKEIVSVMPTMAESPVRGPVSLPYPGIVSQQQQTRSNSTQSFSSISSSALPLSSSEAGSLAGMGAASRSSGMGGGNRFFSGLGRKGSKRAQPSAPVAGLTGTSSLSSIAVGVGGSRAYLANSRNRRTMSPVVTGSMASTRPSTETFETSLSSQSQPESPAAGPGHATVLGLGTASGGDSPFGPLASASTGRLDTVREGSGAKAQSVNSVALSSTPAVSMSATTGLRAPLGPRAQAGASGPTFVSRLGGAPSRDGLSSPELLNPPRSSDLSGTSPPSPRLAAGLRSSLSYGSVRDRMRRTSSPGVADEDQAWLQALTKLGDILPDADQQTLRYYLKKAKGNDLTAIGDYLQDQSLGKLPRF